jgi:hypothetical protein
LFSAFSVLTEPKIEKSVLPCFPKLENESGPFSPLLLYHLLSTHTLPFRTVFFCVLSLILRQKRNNLAHCHESSPFEQRISLLICAQISSCFTRRMPKPCREKGVTL